MTFTSSQKAYIKKIFDDKDTTCSKYALVYKPNNEYKTTWSLTSSPDWDWEHYEYRLLKYLDSPIVKSEVEDVFVYCYKGMIYYNDPNNELHMSYLTGKDGDGALTTAMAVGGDFNAYESVTLGDSSTYDAVLKLVGVTSLGTDITKYLLGPKIKFQKTESSNDGYISITYSDKQVVESTGLLDPTKRPFLRVGSLNNNEYLVVPRKETTKLTVTNKTVGNLTCPTTKINTLTTAINFKNVQQICKLFFPIGCYYWTSDSSFNPDTKFGGHWVKITNAFLYATGYSDGNATTAQHGEEQHTISLSEYASHSHNINDPGHRHNISGGTHIHSMNDPGHMHSIRTIGDDYNGSNCWNQGGSGNFVQDGWWDMTWTNWNRGFWANSTTTGITISSGVTRISVNSSQSGFWLDSSWGGTQPHNNMPPYIAAFCWHRIS